MSTIECTTTFDISETGVTGVCRPDRFPFTDKSGNKISDFQSWNFSRNQQRNLETILQVIGLRTQINSRSVPKRNGKRWKFEFTVDNISVYGADPHEFSVLKTDSDGTPMITGLQEHGNQTSFIQPDKNIWFKKVNKDDE